MEQVQVPPVTAQIEAMDRFNRLIQAEIEATPPEVQLELALIKLKVNQWFYEGRMVVRAK